MSSHRASRRSLPLLLLVPVAGWTQVEKSALTGTVTDQQGNRIAQCMVRGTERATGFQRETVTNSQGIYELAGLPPGSYRIVFSKDGFASRAADEVAQTVGATRTLNIQLELALA